MKKSCFVEAQLRTYILGCFTFLSFRSGLSGLCRNVIKCSQKILGVTWRSFDPLPHPLEGQTVYGKIWECQTTSKKLKNPASLLVSTTNFEPNWSLSWPWWVVSIVHLLGLNSFLTEATSLKIAFSADLTSLQNWLETQTCEKCFKTYLQPIGVTR